MELDFFDVVLYCQLRAIRTFVFYDSSITANCLGGVGVIVWSIGNFVHYFKQLACYFSSLFYFHRAGRLKFYGRKIVYNDVYHKSWWLFALWQNSLLALMLINWPASLNWGLPSSLKPYWKSALLCKLFCFTYPQVDFKTYILFHL